MKLSPAITFWDLLVVASILLPLPLMVAFVSGRLQTALWYLGAWFFIVMLALVAGRVRGFSWRAYKQALRSPRAND